MKKIGEIKGVPVVEGDANLVKNQILYKETDKGISLSKRTNGKLEEVSGGNNGKEGSKFYYYCLDLSKYEGRRVYAFNFLNFLKVNNFTIPGLSKGNCLYSVQGSDDSIMSWGILLTNIASTPQEDLASFFPPIYFALNETSEITFINNGVSTSVIAKGNIIEQFNSFGTALGNSDFFGSLYPLFTEITEEEYLAL